MIRMISNLEADQQKLVQILLVGQNELHDKLDVHNMRQLKSRVVICKQALPLTLKELGPYLSFKLNAAGNNGLLQIEAPAVKLIHRYSQGNFRKVNTLMDRCLYAGFLHETRIIDKRIVSSAIKDLHPQTLKRDSFKKVFCHPFALAALVLMSIGLWYGWAQWKGGGSNPAGLIEAGRLTSVALADFQADSIARPCQPSGPPAEAQGRSPAHVLEKSMPDAVRSFLMAYGLETYAGRFTRALAAGDCQELAQTIYRSSGLQLVQLHRIPPALQSRYDVLQYRISPESSISHFLFWHPLQRFDTFYYSYSGQEINALQSLLARSGFYRGELDGIVGSRLMRAVIKFQILNNLPVTGQPDAATVFLLNHQEANQSHG
jgi:general secretion pathway protein A